MTDPSSTHPPPNNRYTPPAVAREADVDAQPITLQWSDDPDATDGVPITIPPSIDDVDMDVLDAWQAQDWMGMVKIILGVDDLYLLKAEFQTVTGRRPRVRDFMTLIREIMGAWGMEMGESPASTNSSATTQVR